MKSTNNQECRLPLLFSLLIFSPSIHLKRVSSAVFNYPTQLNHILIPGGGTLFGFPHSCWDCPSLGHRKVVSNLLSIHFSFCFEIYQSWSFCHAIGQTTWNIPYWHKICIAFQVRSEMVWTKTNIEVEWIRWDDTKSKFTIKHYSGATRGGKQSWIAYMATVMCTASLSFTLLCLSFKAFFLFVNKFPSLFGYRIQKAHVGGTKAFFMRKPSFSLSNCFGATSLPCNNAASLCHINLWMTFSLLTNNTFYWFHLPGFIVSINFHAVDFLKMYS